MLAPNMTYSHPDGRSLVITTAMDKVQAIGDIWFATMAFGPMTAGMAVTAPGLAEAGFTLDEIQPEPEPELPLPLPASSDLLEEVDYDEAVPNTV